MTSKIVYSFQVWIHVYIVKNSAFLNIVHFITFKILNGIFALSFFQCFAMKSLGLDKNRSGARRARVHVRPKSRFLNFEISLKLTINWNPSRLRHITESPITTFSWFFWTLKISSEGKLQFAFQLLHLRRRGLNFWSVAAAKYFFSFYIIKILFRLPTFGYLINVWHGIKIIVCTFVVNAPTFLWNLGIAFGGRSPFGWERVNLLLGEFSKIWS